MEANAKSESKKTLMISYDLLQQRGEQIEELAKLSQKLLDKMRRQDDRPSDSGDMKKESRPADPDIIDLFNFTAEKMGQQINCIGGNLTQVINMID